MKKEKRIIFAPSILSGDFSNIKESVKLIETANSDWIHLDVMDGVFVPNITFGHKMVEDIGKITNLPLDVHLMTVNPENHIDDFIAAGANYITVHLEAAVHSHRIIQKIKESGCKAGVSIVPGTPASSLSELLPFLDLILIMSVNPGFGGQNLIESTLDKIEYLDDLRSQKGYNYLISIDGGVNRDNAELIRKKGTDVMISGSSFFKSANPAAEANLIRGNKQV
ncbi:MAG: ribulose-phosphate 3-epimerase [Spirochaetia bacterium]|jgi:ribulose-phosphate 3-epimerase|nr:ribulose-phosphate 3-epimerase [Spirochaetia bacterium]